MGRSVLHLLGNFIANYFPLSKGPVMPFGNKSDAHSASNMGVAMFAAINVHVFAKQTRLLLLMFAILSRGLTL